MTEWRLGIFLLHVHKSLIDALELSKVAKEFVSINFRRMKFFFGKFYTEKYCHAVYVLNKWGPLSKQLPTPLIIRSIVL